MSVREIAPNDKAGVKEFVRLERDLMSDQPLFWSGPDSDFRKQLTGRSAFFHDMDHAMFVSGEDARCAALVNRAWQASTEGEDKTGFVGYVAARPDAGEAVSEVIERAEQWLAERGIERVIAPFNGSVMLGMAILTDGFDESPMFPMGWNPPYYRGYLEDAGYSPTYPFWVYEIDFGSERYRETAEQALSSSECETRPIEKRRWGREMETLRELFNAGMADEWEMHEFTSAEWKELFGPMRLAIDARQIQFLLDGDRPIGFVIGFTDLVPAFRSFRGRLGPLRIIKLIRAGRAVTRAGAIGGALLPEYRGRHIAAQMAMRFFRDLEDMGYRRAFYYPVNDENAASRGLAEAIGAEGRLLYHCFDKRLGAA